MAPTNLFVLGATGYIGGAVLVKLRTVYPELTISALVRSEKDAEAVKAAGVNNVILGSHEELEKIRSACATTDIVLNAADADDLPLTRAIIAGLKMRAWHSNNGFKPLLIHTSGTSVVRDGLDGSFTEGAKKVWKDNSETDIRSIPPSNPHRLIDLEIFQADEKGDIRAYIIAPSTIYGVGRGPVRKISQQIPNMIRAAIRRRQTVYVGEGTNKWNNVHIDDVVDLYILIFKHALSSASENDTSPYAKFYFGSAESHVWGDVARALAPLLYKKGLVDNADAKSVSTDDEPRVTATNSRSYPARGFALGWNPYRETLFEALARDVNATVALLQASQTQGGEKTHKTD